MRNIKFAEILSIDKAQRKSIEEHLVSAISALFRKQIL